MAVKNAVANGTTGKRRLVDLTVPEQGQYDALQTQSATTRAAAEAAATQTAADIAADKALVVQFMNSTPGQPTQRQIEDTLRAVVRYLRRRGDDA